MKQGQLDKVIGWQRNSVVGGTISTLDVSDRQSLIVEAKVGRKVARPLYRRRQCTPFW